MGGRDLGFGGLRRGKVCRTGTDGCSNSLDDCQLFGHGLPTVVREASFNLCGDRQELGMGGLDMVVAASIRAKAAASERTSAVPLSPVAIPKADAAAAT